MQPFRYVFIGAGVMGRSLATALIKRGDQLPQEIAMIDSDAKARTAAQQLDCAVFPSVTKPVLAAAQTVVLAVKPQDSPAVLNALVPLANSGTLLVSIMAGIAIKTMQAALPGCTMARVMPNTPAQIGQGMNVYYADHRANQAQLAAIETLLQSAGTALRVDNEAMLDAATAISGCGPAYLYFIAEHWRGAAVELGFTETAAELLVQQTIAGAVQLWIDAQQAPSQLRAQVTSKGGATAAAITYWEQQPLAALFKNGVHQAYARSVELGKMG